MADAINTIRSMLSPGAGRILITYGDSVIGYRVASKLLQAGFPSVRVGIEKSALSSVEKLVEEGAEIKEFSWDKDATYAKALDDVQSVLIITPGLPGMAEKFHNFVAACKHAHVKHVVKVSFYHAMLNHPGLMVDFGHYTPPPDSFASVPLVKMHGHCDEKLVASGLDYTILFASHYMSNPLHYQTDSIRKERKFYGASGGKGVNYVSPNDVAEAAVRTLLAPKDHHRKGYTLTGPAAITDNEVAGLLSKQFNMPVTFVDAPLSANSDADIIALEKVKASGAEEAVGFLSKDFEKLSGHAPETYEEYLLNKDSMVPSELTAFLPFAGEPAVPMVEDEALAA